jgi:hypothetical protein
MPTISEPANAAIPFHLWCGWVAAYAVLSSDLITQIPPEPVA